MGVDVNNLPDFEYSRAFKDSIGIFVVLMLVFTIFSHTVGDNENSRLDTTISIVEDGTLSIDRIHNNTGDKSIIDGTYYSDKAPLPSFLAIPGYALISMSFNESVENKFYSESFRRSHSQKMEWARFVSTVSVSALAGALTSVIFYLFSINLGLKREKSIFVGFLSGLSTLIFPYSTTFHGTMLGTFLLISASYLWFKEDYNASRKTTGLIALLIGLGVASSYLIVIPGGLLLSLNSIERLKDMKLHLTGLFGLLIGLMPLLIFNYLTTGNFLELTTFYSVKPYPNHPIDGYLFGLNISKLTIARPIRALISPLNGLFAYSPILIFGLIGLRNLYSDNKKSLMFILGSFILTLFLVSFIILWPVRAYFGPRYLLPVGTLLIIPFIYEFKNSNTSKDLLIYFAGIISSIIMLSSTQVWKGSSWIAPYGRHFTEMTSLGIYQNRLLEYVSSLPTEGLQTPIISYLTGSSSNFHMVLSTYPQYSFPINLFDTLLTMDTRIISFILIILSASLVLRMISRFETKNLIPVLGGAILLLIIGTNLQTHYMHDWYEKGENDTLQWGREKPDIYFNSQNNSTRIINIEARSLVEKEYQIYHNGNLIEKRDIDSKLSNISEIITPKKGLNRIGFRTDNCNVIGNYAKNNDVRCTTLGLKNYDLEGIERGLVMDNLKSESPTYRSIDNNSRVSTTKDPGKYSLIMNLSSNETSTVSASIDNEKIFSSRVDSFPTTIRSPYFSSEGLDWINFETNCRSCEIKVTDIELKQFEDENKYVRKSTGWYRKIDREDITWSSGNSSILIYNYRNHTTENIITLKGRSFEKTRNITLRNNNEILGEILMPTTYYRILNNGTRSPNSYAFNISLDPGENIVRLNSNENCSIIGEVIGNNDIRCASYGIEEIQLDSR